MANNNSDNWALPTHTYLLLFLDIHRPTSPTIKADRWLTQQPSKKPKVHGSILSIIKPSKQPFIFVNSTYDLCSVTVFLCLIDRALKLLILINHNQNAYNPNIIGKKKKVAHAVPSPNPCFCVSSSTLELLENSAFSILTIFFSHNHMMLTYVIFLFFFHQIELNLYSYYTGWTQEFGYQIFMLACF